MGEIAYAVLTKPGGRRINEDSVMVSEIPGGLAVAVADGLGAHGGGREASAAAVGQVWGCWGKGRLATTEEMRRMVSQADRAVRAVQTPESPGMSTLVFLVAERDRAVWAHVGDSRLYHFRDGQMIFHTLDHSVPQTAVYMGMITEDQIRFHPDRSRILRALGSDSFEPDVDETRISDSGFHAFLLCTDGFWEYVTEDELEKTLYGSRDPEQWLWAMERYLKQKVPEDHDNYTAAAVFISQ